MLYEYTSMIFFFYKIYFCNLILFKIILNHLCLIIDIKVFIELISCTCKNLYTKRFIFNFLFI